jgi:hypothetical protein
MWPDLLPKRMKVTGRAYNLLRERFLNNTAKKNMFQEKVAILHSSTTQTLSYSILFCLSILETTNVWMLTFDIAATNLLICTLPSEDTQ